MMKETMARLIVKVTKNSRTPSNTLCQVIVIDAIHVGQKVLGQQLQHQAWLAKSMPQFINGLKHLGPAYQLVFQSALSRKIKQHYSEQDSQDALPRNARKGHQDPKHNEDYAQNVFSEKTQQADGRMPVRPQVSGAVLMKIVGWNFDHDERDYGQTDREGD